MIEINIPGATPLVLSHLILDYHGTLACDGSILPGVTERLEILAERLEIHIVTADTFGSVRTQIARLPVELAVIPTEKQAQATPSVCMAAIPRAACCSIRASFLPLPMAAELAGPKFSI